jgi:hypothetical protein
MADLPIFAISGACAAALRGHVGNAKGEFAPKSGELHLAAEKIVAGLLKEKAEIDRILAAQIVERRLSEQEKAEQCARLKTVLADTLKSLAMAGSDLRTAAE